MEVKDFRMKILFPVLQALNERGLSEQTDAILYSADFPTEIDFSGDAGSVKLTPYQSPHASINSLTYHWQHVLGRSIGYLNPDNANLYARRIQSPASIDSWTDAQKETLSNAINVLGSCRKPLNEQRKANGGASPGRDLSPGNTNSPKVLDSIDEARKNLSE